MGKSFVLKGIQYPLSYHIVAKEGSKCTNLGWLLVHHGNNSGSASGNAPVPPCPAKHNCFSPAGLLWWLGRREKPEQVDTPKTGLLSDAVQHRTKWCYKSATFWRNRIRQAGVHSWTLTHIANFALLPSTVMVFTLKSTPRRWRKKDCQSFWNWCVKTQLVCTFSNPRVWDYLPTAWFAFKLLSDDVCRCTLPSIFTTNKSPMLP